MSAAQLHGYDADKHYARHRDLDTNPLFKLGNRLKGAAGRAGSNTLSGWRKCPHHQALPARPAGDRPHWALGSRGPQPV